MLIKDLEEGRMVIPTDDEERKLLERLVEKECVDYHDGGYWLTKIGKGVVKELFKRGEKK